MGSLEMAVLESSSSVICFLCIASVAGVWERSCGCITGHGLEKRWLVSTAFQQHLVPGELYHRNDTIAKP